MAKESTFWKNIRDAKIPGDWERIENSLAPNVPDVNYCLGRGIEGWIELKAILGAPKRVDTALAIHHFTDGQRRWLRRRWRLGGAAFLFLKIQDPKENHWLLFDGETAHDWVGRVSLQDHIDLAIMHRMGNFPRESFISSLRAGNTGQVNCPSRQSPGTTGRGEARKRGP